MTQHRRPAASDHGEFIPNAAIVPTYTLNLRPAETDPFGTELVAPGTAHFETDFGTSQAGAFCFESGIDNANFLLFRRCGFGAGGVAVRGRRDADEKHDAGRRDQQHLRPAEAVATRADPEHSRQTPAPAPDMSSEAVLAAAPKAAEPVNERSATADAAPKKKRVVARKPRRMTPGRTTPRRAVATRSPKLRLVA